MSMSAGSRSLERDRCRGGLAVRRRRAEEQSLDDEEQRDRAADRDRQIGHSDRQERKRVDGLWPGRRDQLSAPDQHESAETAHQEFGAFMLIWGAQLVATTWPQTI